MPIHQDCGTRLSPLSTVSIRNKHVMSQLHSQASHCRFDEIYVVYFKTNGRMIKDYPNISNYTKDLFQTPGDSCRSILHCLEAELPHVQARGNSVQSCYLAKILL